MWRVALAMAALWPLWPPSAGHQNAEMGALPGLFEESHCDHDHGPLPSFSAPNNGSIIRAFHGASAQLPCSIRHLGHRTVSWIRKLDDNLQLLTIGEMSHSSDSRIETEFVYPQHWPLRFKPALLADSGLYLCHVSTDPPLIQFVYLEVSVPEPILRLVDSQGVTLSSDQYYQVGSSIELRCEVRQFWTKPQHFYWLRSGRPLVDDLWRGGISIRTESMPDGIGSTLSIANTSRGDAGNYTCVMDTTASASYAAGTVVHILNAEENQAAMQHAVNGCLLIKWRHWLLILVAYQIL